VSRRRLPRSFFARPATEVAPELLGRVLARRLEDGRVLRGRIVEAEAYEPGDPASHGSRRRTAFNDAMFGPPGRLYVYFTYGNHWMANVVTRRDGEPSAVLLRALEPLEGLDDMRRRRGRERPTELCAGPGRLCQAMGIDRELNMDDLVRGSRVWLEPGSPVAHGDVARGIRVGVSVGVEREWRFWVRDHPHVSRGRPGPPASRRARS
jgi:DNA-3-methyladenine glycosylase